MIRRLGNRSQGFKTLDEFLQVIEPFVVRRKPVAARLAETLRSRANLTFPISRIDMLAALGTYDLLCVIPPSPLSRSHIFSMRMSMLVLPRFCMVLHWIRSMHSSEGHLWNRLTSFCVTLR